MRCNIILISFVSILIFLTGCAAEKQEIADSSFLDVKERGKLIVGSAVPYAPMEFFDENGEIVGIDIDIIKEIAAQMSLEIEISDYDWDALFAAIEANEIDLGISSITINPERTEKYLFSVPYFNGGQVVVTMKDNEITSIDNLDDKKIGVQTGTTCEKASKEIYKSSEFVNYPNSDNYVEIIRSGEIDLFIVDYIAGVNFVKQNSDLRIVGEPLTQEFYGIVTKIGNKALIEEVNKVLREMKRTGKLKEIQEKWVK